MPMPSHAYPDNYRKTEKLTTIVDQRMRSGSVVGFSVLRYNAGPKIPHPFGTRRPLMCSVAIWLSRSTTPRQV